MANRERNWNKLFRTYTKDYYKKRSKSPVAMERAYSFVEFKTMYKALENDRKKEQREGLRKKSLNITRDLISRQQKFEYTVSQARIIKSTLKEKFDVDVKFSDIREGKTLEDEQLWQTIAQTRKELFSKGWSKSKTKDYIAQTFFGS